MRVRRVVQGGGLLAILTVGAWCLGSVLRADIKSDTGSIKFDTNADGAAETTITTTGLGIGTTSPSTNLHVLGNAYFQSSNLGIGTATPKSTLDISGSMGFSTQSVTSNVTLSGNSVILADTTSGNIALTLPYAGNATGRTYIIKKLTNSNRLWVGGGGNSVDIFGGVELTSSSNGYPGVSVVSNGNQWYITSMSSGNGSTVTDGIVGWWMFNESSGNTASDASGFSNTGTLKGGLTLTSNAYLNFNMGREDRVEIKNTSSLNVTNLTLLAWVSPTSLAADVYEPTIISKWDTGSASYFTFQVATVYTPDRLLTYRYDGTTQPYQVSDAAGGNVDLNTWTHIALAMSGNNYSFYRNGIDCGNGTTLISGTTPISGNSNLYIGQDYNLWGSWNGLIDDVRIYSRKLSEAEIKAIYLYGRQ